MTKSSWPFVSQATTDLQYSKLFRELQSTGVGRTGNDLKGVPGTGLQTLISPGSALIRGFYFENTSDDPVTHSSNSSGDPRIDRVVLRLDLNQTLPERVQVALLTGTPAPSPSIPSLTQVENGIWDSPLFWVMVVSGAASFLANDIVDERKRLGIQPGRWENDAGRPTTPEFADMGYNTAREYWEFYDGDSWEKFWRGITWADIAGVPTTSTLDGRTLRQGDAAPSNSLGVNGDWYAEY